MAMNILEVYLMIYVLTIVVFILFCLLACGYLLCWCCKKCSEEPYEYYDPPLIQKDEQPQIDYQNIPSAPQWDATMPPACYVNGMLIQQPNNQVYQPVVQPIDGRPATLYPGFTHVTHVTNQNNPQCY